MKEMLDLFFVFAKMGAVTFGGGYAMLPILQREIIQTRGWVTNEELLDYYTVGQCLPGIIAVNTAIFIGHKRRGVLGGVIAALGVVFPAIVIITFIAACLQNFMQYTVVQNALAGIRCAVCALILVAILKLWKSGVKGAFGLVIFIASFVVSCFNVSPVLIVVTAAAIGLLYSYIMSKKAAPADGGTK